MLPNAPASPDVVSPLEEKVNTAPGTVCGYRSGNPKRSRLLSRDSMTSLLLGRNVD